MTKDFSVDKNEPEKDELIYHETAGMKLRAHASWYRGEHTNFHPIHSNLSEENAVEKYVCEGWLPKQPFITKVDYITAFGSCFAAEITKYLYDRKYNVFAKDSNLNSYIIRMGEGLVNSASILAQIEWALKGKLPVSKTWFTKSGTALELNQKVKDNTEKILKETDVFIITYGLSEVWYDKKTGEVFWNAVPKHLFDPKTHGFKILSPEENHFNILRTYTLLRDNNSKAKVIITLSPIPLAATFRPVSCLTANTVSKASLRWAIDSLMRWRSPYDENLYYFPSYEIITEFLPRNYETDLRHPKPETIKFVMKTFERNYCV